MWFTSWCCTSCGQQDWGPKPATFRSCFQVLYNGLKPSPFRGDQCSSKPCIVARLFTWKCIASVIWQNPKFCLHVWWLYFQFSMVEFDGYPPTSQSPQAFSAKWMCISCSPLGGRPSKAWGGTFVGQSMCKLCKFDYHCVYTYVHQTIVNSKNQQTWRKKKQEQGKKNGKNKKRISKITKTQKQIKSKEKLIQKAKKMDLCICMFFCIYFAFTTCFLFAFILFFLLKANRKSKINAKNAARQIRLFALFVGCFFCFFGFVFFSISFASCFFSFEDVLLDFPFVLLFFVFFQV